VSDHVKVLTAENWDAEVTASSETVLVDFWAEWCQPCRMIAPMVEALASDFAGRLKVGKLDVDQNPEIAGRFGVRSIPMLLVIRDGKVVEQRVGALSKDQLVKLVETHLSAGVPSAR